MPFYEYECNACKHYLEALQKISDPPLKKCPECNRQTLKRLVSAPVFRLKGSGWYETDFKSDKEDKRNLAKSDEAPAEPKAEEKKDSAPAEAPKEVAKTGASAATVSTKSISKASAKPAKRSAKGSKAKPAAKKKKAGARR